MPASLSNTPYAVSILVVAQFTIRYLLCVALREDGFVVHEAASEEEGYKQLLAYQPDVVLLELESEKRSLKFVRQIRKKAHVGLILMSAHRDDTMHAAALESGADDLVRLPLNMVDLMARLRALLRRAAWMPYEMSIQVGQVRLDAAEQIIYLDRREVALTTIQSRLLYMLLNHRGEVVTFKQLLAYVWGQFSEKEFDLLHTNIYQLRQKLEPDPVTPRYLVTEAQVGYRFCAEIVEPF